MTKKAIKKADPLQFELDGGFVFTETSCDVTGRPTIDQYEAAVSFAKRSRKASGWWCADLLRYGSRRADWKERLSQVQDMTGLSEKTLQNIRAIGAIEPSRRRDGLEFSLHDPVVGMPDDEQTEWLEKAEKEGWNLQEFRMEIRASKRRKVIEGQAHLAGMYRVIYADPPWAYSNRGDITVGKSSSYKRAEAHYPTMTIEELCKLPIEAHSRPQSVLFLWVTAPVLLENPGPRELIEAWGFTYKTNIVWDKVLGNYGHYVHGSHEHLIVATRGSCLPDRPTPSPDSVMTERRSNEHSKKPESFRALIERLYDGPYLELFGRERKEGWTVFGNDARLWSAEKTA